MTDYHVISCSLKETEARELVRELNEKSSADFMLMIVEDFEGAGK